MKYTIVHNAGNSRFETEVDGYTATLRYVPFVGGLDLVSTHVPAPIEGRGVAAELTRAAMEYARENRLKIIPSCRYIGVFLQRNPEYKNLEI
jgi:predicted GNAT family acetyltransferase